ncbi:hypothetical protein HPP92_008414 [Vanilla planifolia]|uniref:TIR domain-containing protein n=1 Tax=Vanilla planifolia TaxID=51239 RepID=A0A835RAD9_VANPL|nr:hypothetical protein HPP92_008414 [Vanilla planifolia]
MELQQESSNCAVLSTSRNLSSSSSAFVSAIQSPFFSPRSPQSCELKSAKLDGEGSSSLAVISGDILQLASAFRQPEPISKLKLLASDVSTTPSFYASSNFETPAAIFRSSNLVSPNNGFCSSSSYSQRTGIGYPGRRDKQKRSNKSQGKLSFSCSPATLSSANRFRNCDLYIGFHGRKPSLLRFASWLRAELELQGISCFTADRAQCRNCRSRDMAERMMNSSSFGVVILTKSPFEILLA